MSQRATPARAWRAALVAAGCLVAALGLALISGPAGGASADWFVIRDLRLPRALTAALVGGALATSGAMFQVLLRNPLASPYLIGVSGGGSLGAVVAILLGLTELATGFLALPVFSFAGCLGAIGVIHFAASRRGHLRPQELLLAGVVANSFFLAAMSVLQYVADPTQTDSIVRWTLGSIRTGEVPIPLTAALVVAGLVMSLRLARDLNVLVLGDETAHHLGVDVHRVRRAAFLAASLMTAAAVAVSGPIGFLGLFMPHAVRFLVGPDLRVLIGACFFGGAAFLVVADTAARTVLAPSEIPVGVLTAVFGAPSFLWLMMHQRDKQVQL